MDDGELADLGLRAYHAGDFEAAIKYLAYLTKRNTKLWQCRLYLAIAYSRVSKIGNALQELKDITEWCPDRDLREKALVVLTEMNRQSQAKVNTLQSQKRKT